MKQNIENLLNDKFKIANDLDKKKNRIKIKFTKSGGNASPGYDNSIQKSLKDSESG